MQTEFEGDLDYRHIVTDIDYSGMQENVYLTTGTVKSVSAGEKSLVLDLDGMSELELDVRNGTSGIPQEGSYICARYSFGESGLDLVAFDELDAPGELPEVTLPVAKVVGSSLWLLANEGNASAQEGERDYLHIDYRTADMRSLPQEGHYATVYYHDEAYGDASDADACRVSAASAGSRSPRVSVQSARDDMNDSATPGYLELGDSYNNLDYGSEVFHVANVIAGTDARADDMPSASGDNPSGACDEPAASSTGETSSSRPAPASASSAVSNAGNTRSTSSPTAETGDAPAALGGALSAAAVAGAALVAYSARRIANEQAGPEEDVCEPESDHRNC